jgi:AcrR family transcriptional regulator
MSGELTEKSNSLSSSGSGLGLEGVVEIQRARLLAAMTEVCVERGAGNVTVAHVVERAGVSRRTFYEIFTDREGCFLAAFDEVMARVSGYVLDAYDPGARWDERIRMALTALLDFLEVERGAGRLLIIESLGAGPSALERRRRVLAQIIALIDEGHRKTKTSREPPPLTAEGIAGGVLSILHARLSHESKGQLLELTSPLMSMIVLPYLGSAAARRELERPVPKSRMTGSRANGNPLRELEMRLTYRTVRVLVAVAVRPGGSNREVADVAGIADQGQISKLLTRLHGLGLIENTGAGSARGAPNSWRLTVKGWEVEGAVAGQTGDSLVATST